MYVLYIYVCLIRIATYAGIVPLTIVYHSINIASSDLRLRYLLILILSLTFAASVRRVDSLRRAACHHRKYAEPLNIKKLIIWLETKF